MNTLKQTKIWCEKGKATAKPVTTSLRPNYKLESDHNFGITVT